MNKSMNKSINTSKKILLWDLLCFVILIVLDRVTKYLSHNYCKDENYILIENGFEITYIENYGGALGILNNQKFFFIFISALFICLILFFLFVLPTQKTFSALNIWLSFMVAGTVGNMIDRIAYDYVIDFIYFPIIKFPVFNLSDIWVTIGAIATLIILIFKIKEKDLEFLNFKQNKYREIK